MRRLKVLACAAVAAIVGIGMVATDAAAFEGEFAPLGRKGPRLPVAKEKLRASVECTDDVAAATRAPVLLLPATGVDSHSNFSWNWEQLLAARGIPHCTSDQPGRRSTNLTDIQTRGYYLTYAVRHVYRLAGRKIALMGHSQGGMVSRLPLRFWPDTRKKVDDVIGFAGTNRGTTRAEGAGDTAPANHQQAASSDFIRALNSRTETFAGISYTEIFTNLDEVVTPPRRASSVSGPGRITNVAVQEICPLDTYEHLGIGTLDPVAAALALNALNHDGPADVARVGRTVCFEPFMPGFDPLTDTTEMLAAARQLLTEDAADAIPEEPRLRCWVFDENKACRRQKRRS